MSLLDGELNEKPMQADINNVIDISLDTATKQRFRINGDNDAIIELNVSDFGIIERLEKGLTDLDKHMKTISNIPDSMEDKEISVKLKEVDKHMRECVDYIFDYPVSAVCAKGGTMYDPKGGKFRYEAIIDGLLQLYTDNINHEAKLIEARVKKHTDKYTSKKKK